MITPSLFAVPFLVMASQYNLTILKVGGEKIEIPTSEIEKMEFVEVGGQEPGGGDEPGPVIPPDPSGNFKGIKPGTVAQPDLTPGFKGSFFAPGVSATEGYVDADKHGKNGPYRDDTYDCWAMAAGDVVQWWLNDYKAWTGRDFVTAKPLPDPSLYNNIPVVDAFIQAYNDTNGGDPFQGVEWFFKGVERNSWMNDFQTYNEEYPYWKGGFGGITEERLRDMLIVQEDDFGYGDPKYMYFYDDPKMKNLSADDFAVAFTRQLLESFQYGALQISTISHAMACFGVEYTVDANGNPRATAIYLVDNDPVPANVRNGYNMAVPKFRNGELYLEYTSATNGGYYPLTSVKGTFGLKSVRFMKSDD